MVLAPYGILQSLIRARDLDRDARVGGARARAAAARFGIDLVPDVPKWREYENRVQLRGRARRRAADARRIGPPGSEAAADDVRADATSSGAGGTTREHRFDLTFRTLSVRQMTAPARTRRVSRRRGARRLPRRPVGRARRRLDHPGEKEVTFRSCFRLFPWSFDMSGHSKWASIKHKKGAARRQARQDFHAPHQGTDRRGPHRRRRSRHEPAPAHDHRRRQGGQHAGRQHQARHPPRHRRRAGRVVRRSAVRGLRARRRRGHHRRAHRQQEPHGRRDPPHAREARRQPRRRPTPSPGCSTRRATSSSRSRRPTKRS